MFLISRYLGVISTHLPLEKMATISQTSFSSAFSWMKKNCVWITIELNFVPKGPINSFPALVQIMAWRRLGNIWKYWKYILTVYPKKYAHGFCFAVLCCGYILTDFPISIRLTSLALWQSNDCPGASKATLMNMDKYFMWIHYERLHNHNKATHTRTVCIFLGLYCTNTHKHTP